MDNDIRFSKDDDCTPSFISIDDYRLVSGLGDDMRREIDKLYLECLEKSNGK